jgi:hypothetical protein
MSNDIVYWWCCGTGAFSFLCFHYFVFQEAMKAVTAIFTPIHQFLYFDALECLPGDWSEFDANKLTEQDCAPV